MAFDVCTGMYIVSNVQEKKIKIKKKDRVPEIWLFSLPKAAINPEQACPFCS